MKTFTIDAENSITVFATKKEAAAASTTPFDSFANQNELAELTAEWPVQRLVEIWNGIPGINAVTKFTSRKIATERIWKAVQSLGDRSPDVPVVQPEEHVPAIPEAAPASEPAAEATNGPAPATASPEIAAEPAAEELVPAVPQDATEETLATVGEQAPDVAPAAAEPTSEALRRRPRKPRRRRSPRRLNRDRARAARPLRWLRCSSGMAAPPSLRS